MFGCSSFIKPVRYLTRAHCFVDPSFLIYWNSSYIRLTERKTRHYLVGLRRPRPPFVGFSVRNPTKSGPTQNNAFENDGTNNKALTSGRTNNDAQFLFLSTGSQLLCVAFCVFSQLNQLQQLYWVTSRLPGNCQLRMAFWWNVAELRSLRSLRGPRSVPPFSPFLSSSLLLLLLSARSHLYSNFVLP